MDGHTNKNEVGEYPVHWLEGVVNKIEKRKVETVNLATGKTPSGHIHLGILRELLICDAIRRIFERKNKPVNFRLFLDNLDAAKRFPHYIPENYAKEHLGKPFALIPDPFQKTEDSYGEVFGKELINTFEELGIGAKIVWTDQLYKTNKMKKMIRIGLKKNDEVKKIVAKYLTSSMTEDQRKSYLEQQKSWMGAMVICEKCQRTQKKQKDGTIRPNRVLAYDPETDLCEYECPACGYKSKVGIDSGLIKLNWRLDWPAKWTIFSTVCEPAGKDHCTLGGSYDTGLDLCRNIYGYEGPIKVAYEWLRLGDRDMGTSKGIVFTPKKYLSMAKPEIIRMIIYRTNPNKHISVRIEEMEQYYNEFHRLERIYYGLEEASSNDEKKEIMYLYPLIQSQKLPKECPPQIPFKLMTVLAQLKPILKEEGIYKRAQEYLNDEGQIHKLTKDEFLKNIDLAINWVKEIKLIIENEKDPAKVKKLKYKIVLFSITPEISQEIRDKLNNKQKNSLKLFLNLIKEEEKLTNDLIREQMMKIRDQKKISASKIFQAFYLILLGKKRGPRLGPLMEMLDKEWIEKRLQEAIK